MFEFIKGHGAISFPGLGFEINPPQGFTLFGKASVQFYGLIIAIGLILAAVYGLRRAKQFGLKQDDVLDGVLWIVPVAVICARLYYVIFQWDIYKDDPISILYIWKGGLAIYGGVIGAALCLILHCQIKKVSLGALLDLVALGFLIGQAIGRWGNFFNREAFGAETESFLRMGLYLTADGAFSSEMHYFHPTFLYESLWNIVGFVALHFLSKKRQYDGQIALGYLAWYGLGRTLIEGLRTDSLYIFKNWLGETLRVSQLVAALSCAVAVAVLIIMAFRKHDRANLFVNRVAAMEAAAAEEAEEEFEEEEEAEEAEEAFEEEIPESDNKDIEEE